MWIRACLLATVLAAGLAERAIAQAAPAPPQATDPCAPGVPGGYCGDGRLSDLTTGLSTPRDVAVTATGDLLIADGQNSVVRRVSGGVVSTVAGLGVFGESAPRRPASVADVALADPRGVAALPDGAFAIADAGLGAVLLVTPDDGQVRTLLRRRAGRLPVDVVARDADTLAVADAAGGRVLEVDLDGTVRTVARGLEEPRQIALEPASGALIVSQASASPEATAGRRTRGNVVRLAADGTRTVVAGPGAPGVPGTLRFTRVAGVAVRLAGAILVADRAVVRAVMPTGDVVGIAGDPAACGLPRAVPEALLQIEGIALDGAELLIADAGHDRVVRAGGALDGPRPATPPPDPQYPLVCGAKQSRPRAQAAQPPGTAVCRGSLPTAFQVIGSYQGRVKVSVTGSGVVALELIRGRKRAVYVKSFKRGQKAVFIQVRETGRFSLRLSFKGKCRGTAFEL
jgi:hypothetical protein